MEGQTQTADNTSVKRQSSKWLLALDIRFTGRAGGTDPCFTLAWHSRTVNIRELEYSVTSEDEAIGPCTRSIHHMFPRLKRIFMQQTCRSRIDIEKFQR